MTSMETGVRSMSGTGLGDLVSAYGHDDDDEEDMLHTSNEEDILHTSTEEKIEEVEQIPAEKVPEHGHISGSDDDEQDDDSDSDSSSSSEETPPLPSGTPPSTSLVKTNLSKQSTTLVSYTMDKSDDSDRDSDMELVTDEQSPVSNNEPQDSIPSKPFNLESCEGKIRIPPEPPGKCSAKLQEEIRKLYEKVKNGYNLNAAIQRRKDFRNPSIYEKLVDYCNIDEKGTNYPPELFDLGIWGPDSYYDALAKAQKVEMDKREKDRKEKLKADSLSGTKKPIEGPEVKRKTKWDTITTHPNIVTSNIALTTTVSGTKSTIIPAIGSIKKLDKR